MIPNKHLYLTRARFGRSPWIAISDPASRVRAAERVKAVFESLDPDKRTRLDGLWKSMRVEATVEAEFDSIFDAVSEASRNESWEVSDEEEKASPVRVRKATFERGLLARTFFMQAMSGGGVILKQQPWEPPQAAELVFVAGAAAIRRTVLEHLH